MGLWEKQLQQTNRSRKLWAEAQEFNLVQILAAATNEEEVKAAYIREFSLPVKTQERHDLVVDKIMFEFKYSVKLSDPEVASKVISQVIYYVNRLFRKGRLDEIEYIVIADKDEARLFRVTEFQLFYESTEYQWDTFRPSSPDPQLISAIRASKILESNRTHHLTSQEDLHLFSSRLYQILQSNAGPSNNSGSLPAVNHPKPLKPIIIGIGLLISLLSGVAISYQYHSSQIQPVDHSHSN
jgi:hypothetical protein